MLASQQLLPADWVFLPSLLTSLYLVSELTSPFTTFCFLWIVFFKHPNSPKQTGKSHKPVSREDDNGFVSLQRKQMKRYDDKIHCRTPFASSFTFWIRRAVRSHSLPTQVLFAFFLLHI